MKIFYYDDEIKKLELNLNYTSLVKRLESIFFETKDADVLSSIIGCSWLYYIEGNVKQVPTDYDYQYFKIKWKEYVDIGLNEFRSSAGVCFIIAYTLDLHWFHLGVKYENKHKDLYKRAIKLSNEENIKVINRYFLSNDFKSINSIGKICKETFPTESNLDLYFKEILNLKLKP